MVQGGMTCVKYLVFAFNFIFFCFGITLIAVGAVVQVQLRDYMDFFAEGVNGPAIMLIIIGLVIFVISFFGCCGAIKENYCMVITFAALLVVILVCEVGGAIAGFVYSSQIEILLKNGMFESMEKYPDNTDIQKTWNHTQSTISCCGVDTPEDWQTVTKFEQTPPPSCCAPSKACEGYSDVTFEGCLDALKGKLGQNVFAIGAVGISLAIIQVSGIVLACCLARAVHKEYEIS